MKNSSMPVRIIQMFKAEAMKTREDFIVFNGPDEQLVSVWPWGRMEESAARHRPCVFKDI